uniref:Repulsive guidance molecule BMP co-receptor b n=1 Tax=Athene cunicularia TaxID=194338 RepID=A0A663ND03_ATHCN
MSQRNCSKDGPTSSTNPEVTHDPCNYSGHTEAREHQAVENTTTTYLFCGLFGDPHLKTFKDHLQTCKVEGAWPLIDSKYLSVQVTNVPVVPGSSTTHSVTDDLAAAFVGGTTSGLDGYTKSLRIVEKVSGKYIKMHTRYIGTTVYILQLGHYLTLAIRMPQELIMAYEESQDLQLCVNGCSSSERIGGSGHLPLPCSLETATTKCHEKMLVKYIYFYSCVFDLLATGDANFTAAAHSLTGCGGTAPQKRALAYLPQQ